MRCLAYFVTFRTYGSWLPGDERTFVDHCRGGHGASSREPHSGLHRAMTAQKKHEVFVLDSKCRALVEQAIKGECEHRGWTLHVLAVRTNHVHVIVSATETPEKVMSTFKVWATRRLREAQLAPDDVKFWARHGSTRYLWNTSSLKVACRYVAEGQGEDLSA